MNTKPRRDAQRLRNRRFLAWTGASVIAVAAVLLPIHLLGYRINETASLPVGLWRIADVKALHAGLIVNFCPPNNDALQQAKKRGYLDGGRCAGNLEPMFKHIVATAGDRVAISARGVSVNGQLIEGSAAYPIDGAGAPMPRPSTGLAVADGEAWVVSTYSPNSFDSRYFGPIKTASVFGVASPVFLWSSQ